MDNESMALKLQETTDRSIRNEGRIKKLESEQSELRELTTSVALLAQQMESMTKSIDTMSGKVGALEAKPGKRWDGLVDKLLSVAAGAVLAWVAAGAPVP